MNITELPRSARPSWRLLRNKEVNLWTHEYLLHRRALVFSIEIQDEVINYGFGTEIYTQKYCSANISIICTLCARETL